MSKKFDSSKSKRKTKSSTTKLTSIPTLTKADWLCAKIENDYATRATRKITNKELKHLDMETMYMCKSSSLKSFDSHDSFRTLSRSVSPRRSQNVKSKHLTTTLSTSNYTEYIKPNSNLINSRLTILEKMKCLEVLNRKIRMTNVENKSILRDKQPILFQSMHVDKWLRVFVHPQKQVALDQMQSKLFGIIETNVNKKDLLKSRIHAIKGLDYNDILKQINRIETNNGFNLAVSRIKDYLEDFDLNENKERKDSKNKAVSLFYKNLRNNSTLDQHFKQIVLTR
jgi:hypothetical protein